MSNVTLTDEQFAALLARVGPSAAPAVTVPIAEAMRKWEAYAAGQLKRSTQEFYRIHIKSLIEFSGVENLGELTRDHIEAYRTSRLQGGTDFRPWKPQSADNAVRMAATVYRWMMDHWEVDAPDPFGKVKRLRITPKERRFLQPAEIDRLLEVAKECHGRRESGQMRGWNAWASILLGAYAGLRKAEVVHARWEWFAWDRGAGGMLCVRPVFVDGRCVWEPKSRASAGDVPIHPKLRESLYRYRQESGWIIAPEKGITSTYRYRYDGKRAFNRACKLAGLPWVTMHVLRHSIASLMAEQGYSPVQIAMMLRHGDLRCVSVYTHPRSESLDIASLQV